MSVTGFSLDQDLVGVVEREGLPRVRVWEPPATAVVLGRSNRAEREVRLAQTLRDGVPILRRSGGGGAVVLARGCLAVSLAWPVTGAYGVGRAFQWAVDALAASVAAVSGVSPEARGSGDLCVGERKLLGSSVYGRRGSFLYQASLLVDMDLTLVERYLAHPSREPGYRRGRPHREFLTTLRAQGCADSCGELRGPLAAQLRRRLAAGGAPCGPAGAAV